MHTPENTHTSSQTQFKMVIYYSHRDDGTPYTAYEISIKANRKYADSIDTKPTRKGGNRTDHREAMYELIRKVKRERNRIIKANLIINDHDEQMEITIAKYLGADAFVSDNFLMPQFTQPDDEGNIYYQGLNVTPLRIDPMRVQNLNYKNDKAKKWQDYQDKKKNNLEKMADILLRNYSQKK